MIDLKKELKALKTKAMNLMTLGDVKAYIQTLQDINGIQLKLVSVKS